MYTSTREMAEDTDQDWKLEFRNILLSDGVDSMQRAVEFKEAHAPEILYKFFPPSTYAFEALQRVSLYLAPPADFNDPYDSAVAITGASDLFRALLEGPHVSDWREVGKGLFEQQDLLNMTEGHISEEAIERFVAFDPATSPEEIKKLAAVIPLVLEKVMSQMFAPFQELSQRGNKVTCFSERMTNAMWAHYSASHTGFCAEYRYADIPEPSMQRRLLLPVVYAAERFDLSPTFSRGLRGDLPNLTYGIATVLHKSPDWAHEREWRMVNPDGRDDGGMTVPFVLPSRIIAGVRMTEENLEKLTGLCRAKDVELVQASLSGSTYEMILKANASAADRPIDAVGSP